MNVYCKGAARVRHQATGQIYVIDNGDLAWKCAEGDWRSIGIALHYEAAYEHPELGVLTWGLWELPSGVQSFKSTEVGGHELLTDVDFGLEPLGRV